MVTFLRHRQACQTLRKVTIGPRALFVYVVNTKNPLQLALAGDFSNLMSSMTLIIALHRKKINYLSPAGVPSVRYSGNVSLCMIGGEG